MVRLCVLIQFLNRMRILVLLVTFNCRTSVEVADESNNGWRTLGQMATREKQYVS